MNGQKILVVDDEPAIRELIVAVLEDEGYEAIGTGSGSRALELLPRERPDLVLMDIMMPEMDGREALRRMRQRPEWAATPVVLMSAAAVVGPGSGAAFLAKLFDLDFLLGIVASLLAGGSDAAS